MDVGYPRGVLPSDQDILVQQMADCQNGLNAEYSNKLNEIVDGLRSTMQDYLDRNHPGLAVPQNGPHFQVVKNSFEELAFVILEALDAQSIFEELRKMSTEIDSKIDVISLESAESIRDDIAVAREMRLCIEQRVRKLTLKIQKLSSMAKIRIDDVSFFGILRKGIAAVADEEGTELSRLLAVLRTVIENAKDQEESFIGLLNSRVKDIKARNEYRELLIQVQSKASDSIFADAVTSLLCFIDLPQYLDVLKGKRFSNRVNKMYKLALLGETKGTKKARVDSNSKALETLPYEVLNCLLEMVPSSTKEGRNLRRRMVDNKAIDLVLDCFHRSTSTEASSGSDFSVVVGSGSHSFEEKVTCLLNVLFNFVGTQEGDIKNASDEFLLEVYVLLRNSSVMSALSSYLRKDSVFNFAGNVPMYKVIFKLLGSIASIPQLSPLLISGEGEGRSVILESLKKLRNDETTDASDTLHVSTNQDLLDLVQLLPDVQTTTAQVEVAVMEYLKMEEDWRGSSKMETQTEGFANMS